MWPKTITREIPVTIVNAEVLEQANMTYEVIGKSTATISFKAKTKDEYKIKSEDFYASADIAEMYDVTGAIPITVRVVSHEDLIESGPTVRSPEVIRIQTEPLQTKEFALKAYPQGTVEGGYQAGGVTMRPDTVTVKGPQSLIGQISSVGIEFDVDGADADVSGQATPGFYDANGNALEMDESVKLLSGDVAYTMRVLQLKEIPLNFIVAGNVAEGFRFVGAETTVPAITVAGTNAAVTALSEIRIQNPALNVEGARSDVTTEVDISSYLPAGLTVTGLSFGVGAFLFTLILCLLVTVLSVSVVSLPLLFVLGILYNAARPSLFPHVKRERRNETLREKVARFDTNFSLQDFFSNVENKLSGIHFAETETQVNAYSGMNLSELLPRYRNVASCAFDNLELLDFRVEKEKQMARVRAEMQLLLWQNGTMTEKTETVQLLLSKAADCLTQAVFEPEALRCRGCGASIDLMEGRYCSFCGRELELERYDWCVKEYEVI